MLKGYIDQKVNRAFASKRRVGSSLCRVAPYYHNHRQRGTELKLNHQPYTAEYHGHRSTKIEFVKALNCHFCFENGKMNLKISIFNFLET